MPLEWHERLFLYGNYLSYLLFFCAFIGVLRLEPKYLSTLNTALKYYIAIFLIIHFNPIIRIKVHNQAFDRNIAFKAGIFLLLTSTATSIASDYINYPIIGEYS